MTTPRMPDAALLESKRGEIDAIDCELIELLQRRARVALEIGRLKQALGLPLHDPIREQSVSGKIAACKGGALPGPALQAIWAEIMKVCRELQEAMLPPKNTK